MTPLAVSQAQLAFGWLLTLIGGIGIGWSVKRRGQVTLERIIALRDLNYGQLAVLARKNGLIKRMPEIEYARREVSDPLRLKLIDALCDEELKRQGEQ